MIKLMGFDDFCRFTLTRHSLLAIGINLKVPFLSIMCSEGGTEEDRRIDPPLNFGKRILLLYKTILIFGKNWF